MSAPVSGARGAPPSPAPVPARPRETRGRELAWQRALGEAGFQRWFRQARPAPAPDPSLPPLAAPAAAAPGEAPSGRAPALTAPAGGERAPSAPQIAGAITPARPTAPAFGPGLCGPEGGVVGAAVAGALATVKGAGELPPRSGEAAAARAAEAAPRTAGPARDGVRVHVECSNEGVRLWVGVDLGYGTSPDRLARALAAEVDRRLAAHGQHVSALVCNGRAVPISPTEVPWR